MKKILFCMFAIVALLASCSQDDAIDNKSAAILGISPELPSKTRAIIDSTKEEIEKLESLGKPPIVITSPIVRIYYKKMTEQYLNDLIVVSYNEIESNVELQSVGTVKI